MGLRALQILGDIGAANDRAPEDVIDTIPSSIEGLAATRAPRRIKNLAKGLEGLSQYFWDSVQIATAATTDLAFFQVPYGQDSKTMLDTNNKSSGVIQDGQAFDVHNIGVALRHSASTPIPVDEMREIFYLGYLQLTIAERSYGSWPLWALPAGGGVWGFSEAASAATGHVVNNGVPAANNMFRLLRKIRIPQNVPYLVQVKWPTAPTPTTAIKMIVVLNGVLWRARV